MTLTQENYFSAEANRAYLSVSQYKAFRRCEAAATAELYGKWQCIPTTAMLVGSYVDAYFEGALHLFVSDHPEICKRDGSLKADFAYADEIISRIEADPMFMDYMSGQKQTIITAPLFGAEWKIKVDSLCPDKIVDLKIMRSLDRVMGRSFVEHWEYDTQMAIYAQVEALARYQDGAMSIQVTNALQRKPTYLAVATKENPVNIELIGIPDWRLVECLADVQKYMPRILALKAGRAEPVRCGVCDYCRATKVLKAPVDFDLVGLSANELAAIGIQEGA